MYKIWVSLLSTNRGFKNHFFRRLRNSTTNLTAHIFEKKQDIGLDNRASALTTTWGFLHRLKTT